MREGGEGEGERDREVEIERNKMKQKDKRGRVVSEGEEVSRLKQYGLD